MLSYPRLVPWKPKAHTNGCFVGINYRVVVHSTVITDADGLIVSLIVTVKCVDWLCKEHTQTTCEHAYSYANPQMHDHTHTQVVKGKNIYYSSNSLTHNLLNYKPTPLLHSF